ncbi:uncharacterized protein LOC134160586 [Pezoporus occidentalis]|uniref:uncharacterized protein LOC134160586 n=1 Tax=Pezoporus occidentalis TaxID=407982 RepID=UPI002F91352B
MRETSAAWGKQEKGPSSEWQLLVNLCSSGKAHGDPEPCQQNADLAKAEEQKAAARSRYRERREESEGFHRPPAAERRLSIKCARWGREKREVKGDASSERVRGCVIPVRSCRSGGGEPEGRRSWRCLRRLRRSLGPCPRGPEGFGGRRLGEQPAAQGPGGRGGRGSLGLPGREALLPALGRPRSPGGRDRSCRIPANLACLMNKPAIRLMLPVTLPSSKDMSYVFCETKYCKCHGTGGNHCDT